MCIDSARNEGAFLGILRKRAARCKELVTGSSPGRTCHVPATSSASDSSADTTPSLLYERGPRSLLRPSIRPWGRSDSSVACPPPKGALIDVAELTKSDERLAALVNNCSRGRGHRRSRSDSAVSEVLQKERRNCSFIVHDALPPGLPAPLAPQVLAGAMPLAKPSRGHRRSLSDGASPLDGMPEAFCRTVYTANPPSRVQRDCLQGRDPPALARRRPPPIKLKTDV